MPEKQQREFATRKVRDETDDQSSVGIRLVLGVGITGGGMSAASVERF